jgi:hypothetical protein
MRFYIGLFYGQRRRFPAKSQRPTEGYLGFAMRWRNHNDDLPSLTAAMCVVAIVARRSFLSSTSQHRPELIELIKAVLCSASAQIFNSRPQCWHLLPENLRERSLRYRVP